MGKRRFSNVAGRPSNFVHCKTICSIWLCNRCFDAFVDRASLKIPYCRLGLSSKSLSHLASSMTHSIQRWVNCTKGRVRLIFRIDSENPQSRCNRRRTGEGGNLNDVEEGGSSSSRVPTIIRYSRFWKGVCETHIARKSFLESCSSKDREVRIGGDAQKSSKL